MGQLMINLREELTCEEANMLNAPGEDHLSLN